MIDTSLRNINLIGIETQHTLLGIKLHLDCVVILENPEYGVCRYSLQGRHISKDILIQIGKKTVLAEAARIEDNRHAAMCILCELMNQGYRMNQGNAGNNVINRVTLSIANARKGHFINLAVVENLKVFRDRT
jgi:hypothetical protein